MAEAIKKYGAHLDLENSSKILNMLQATEAGNAVEYQQFVDTLADYLLESQVVTSMTEAAGTVADTPTVKSYVDTALANLVNSAPEAYDTLKEIADWIDTHEDVYEALVSTVGNKLDSSAVTTNIEDVGTKVPTAETVKAYVDTVCVAHVLKAKGTIASVTAHTPFIIQHNLGMPFDELACPTYYTAEGEVEIQTFPATEDANNRVMAISNSSYTNLKFVVMG